MVGSKKGIGPLSVYGKGISYALGDTFMLLKAVAIVLDRAGNGSPRRCSEAGVVSSLKHSYLVKDEN
ncbi:UNVERIFIED_CONTAM: hypothetical protein Slati_2707400 [Sesamum latifolium]|uniref:Uncharacterized protein n=1 Tax=Sesamum latifolium TaxID=2727402 RepID=A0AAW2VXT8_9LAMI